LEERKERKHSSNPHSKNEGNNSAVHAQPQQVDETYANGSRYVGTKVDGKREGLGTYYYNNGGYFTHNI
jgi:hypothetical protein